MGIELNHLQFERFAIWVVEHFGIENIVETGTFIGTGSTTSWAKTDIPVTTIECNKDRYRAALMNLKAYKNVTVLHGFTLEHSKCVEFIKKDNYVFPNNIRRDFPQSAEKEYYLREINQNEKDKQNLLLDLIDNDKKQVIFLDSCGAIGFLEFKIVMESKYIKNKILVMDDVDHIKHFRSIGWLDNNKFNVFYFLNGRCAWSPMHQHNF